MDINTKRYKIKYNEQYKKQRGMMAKLQKKKIVFHLHRWRPCFHTANQIFALSCNTTFLPLSQPINNML